MQPYGLTNEWSTSKYPGRLIYKWVINERVSWSINLQMSDQRASILVD